ncbi:EamA-like transporter family protein [Tenacibaculum sp. MAR_2009_124]|uniref:EamA family transporter n=1 Tax=Tenacibaculum sp. MAR_2009_124 TaxID=1250059 RepID=UPI00089AB6D9|nr:EamA family transporter [Tenacibaculum sp. MAR_2009_124]SEB43675.1 EamA-like transporter family protein [Tenacibaculum sp. MAR_2009_124]
MLHLILSILFSTSLFAIFKYFGIYKVNTLQAIVVNYIVAFFLGMLSANTIGAIGTISSQPWFLGAVVLGLLFVTVFFVMAKTAQYNGVSVASIAGKMSVVVPIVFGIILYKESVTFFKVVGIITALVAVYLSSAKDTKSNSKGSFLFPVLLFLGSGVIDTTLKYVETNYVSHSDVDFFSGSLFGFAAFFGLIILTIKYFVTKEKLELKSIIAGVVLGIPNYYSIVFLVKALQNKNFESSDLFTINNVGIVVVSTLLGLLLFKESFSTKNKIGVILAIVGIILVTIA